MTSAERNAIARGIEEFRAFVRDKIEPMTREVRVYHAPAADRVSVSAWGMFVRRKDVARFRAVARDIGYEMGVYRRAHLVACFAATLEDAGNVEAAALVASCLNYHDDRGDGNLWVPAFKACEVYDAWLRACDYCGVASVCRRCVC